jgi:hypothetical protein
MVVGGPECCHQYNKCHGLAIILTYLAGANLFLPQSPYYLPSKPEILTFNEPKNRFQGTYAARLCSMAGRYDNPIPTRFLAPIDCLTIATRDFKYMAELDSKIKLQYTSIIFF